MKQQACLRFQVTRLTGCTITDKKDKANDWSVHWFPLYERIRTL
jgi:hypothetical protein